MNRLADHLIEFERMDKNDQVAHLRATSVSETRFALLDWAQRCDLHDELHGIHPVVIPPPEPQHVEHIRAALALAFEAGTQYGLADYASGSAAAAIDWPVERWIEENAPAIITQIEEDLQ